jgi:hypothetical protein
MSQHSAVSDFAAILAIINKPTCILATDAQTKLIELYTIHGNHRYNQFINLMSIYVPYMLDMDAYFSQDEGFERNDMNNLVFHASIIQDLWNTFHATININV